METGRYKRPYEYIRLSPAKSRPKKRKSNKKVEIDGCFGGALFVEDLDSWTYSNMGSKTGKPAD